MMHLFYTLNPTSSRRIALMRSQLSSGITVVVIHQLTELLPTTKRSITLRAAGHRIRTTLPTPNDYKCWTLGNREPPTPWTHCSHDQNSLLLHYIRDIPWLA